MKEKIKFRRKIGDKGGTPAISFPVEVMEWLGAEMGSSMIIMPDISKHGKFVAIWVDNEVEENVD